MNCCDDYGNCRQGHGCPVRTTPVATTARKGLAKFARFIVYGLIGILMWGGLIYVIAKSAPSASTYDCSLASFHPDYPASVRKQCREVKR